MGFISGPGEIKIGLGTVQASSIAQVTNNQYVVQVVYGKVKFVKLNDKSPVSWFERNKFIFFQELQNGRTTWTTWTAIDIQWLKKILTWTRTWNTRVFAWTTRGSIQNPRGLYGRFA